ncbi:DnaJ-domain-containing protein [Violaceomyces palustris]|uniref:DnaJ-domain-containing protein n=1 Tax=Violaceomyces palustris TaxID=1673888 RepID=A0ACD0NSD5_9BASI|nr:DnaJ-domain-containing protein [Violaceomyces palustris]
MQLSSNFSLVFTFLSWSFLPSIVTKFLLTLLYSFSILPKPSNPSQAATHAHSARAFAILAYLAYSFSQTIQTLPPNYYQLLELPLDVDPDAVKKSFRSLARKYHPDKVGDRGQALFILLRKAHDVLQDPVKRFAYDRFGPEVLDWRDAISLREHMIKGLKSSIGFYIVNPIVYAIINYFGGGNKGGSDFWRLALLFSMLSLELHLLLSQNYPFLPRILLPRTTIHQFISVLHEVFTITLLASQQLGPVLKSLDRHALDQMLVGGAIGTDQDKDPNELSRQMEVVASLSAELQQKSSANLSRCVSLVAAE